MALLVALLALPACSNGSTSPDSFRFGQDGDVRVVVETPIWAEGGARGKLEQSLEWRSTGQWSLLERIAYRDESGDSTVRNSDGDPAIYASAYASLITLVNESEGVKLFVEGLDPGVDPECGSTRSRVAVRIRDPGRGRSIEWIRCAAGSLAELNPADAGPPETRAARVIQAARLAREFVLGSDFRSAYVGTVPFATLARRETSDGGTPEPAVFVGDEDGPPSGWTEFWRTHVGAEAPGLEVDWSREMVIAATVGEVPSAGHEVEVRRILPVDRGTQVEVFLRKPGDFCSPASRVQTPFHVVVAPRTPEPVSFQQHRTEIFRCGV